MLREPPHLGFGGGDAGPTFAFGIQVDLKQAALAVTSSALETP